MRNHSNNFYRIYNRKKCKFITSYNDSVWYESEITVVKKVIKHRSYGKKYNPTDVVVIEFSVDKLPVWYYCIDGELTPYENTKDIVEAIYD